MQPAGIADESFIDNVTLNHTLIWHTAARFELYVQVTTPDDMLVAEGFLMSKGVEDTLGTQLSDFSEASTV